MTGVILVIADLSNEKRSHSLGQRCDIWVSLAIQLQKMAIYLLNAQPLGDMVFPTSTSKMWVVVFIAVFDARVIMDRLLTI